MMNQEEIWINHIKNMAPLDVVQDYKNPAVFQQEFSALINGYAGQYVKVIEVGCETGVTSFILSDKFRKSLLDLNPNAIALAKESALLLNKEADFFVGDMFKMDFVDGYFDLVFNAGVIEHFDKAERVVALREYARILRPGGKMIIGYPNHHCPPYRFAYLVLRLFGRWQYPSEYKLYDLKEEIDLAGLVLEQRLTLSRKTIFNWLSFARPIKRLFMALDRYFDFEGYLTVLIIAKQQP